MQRGLWNQSGFRRLREVLCGVLIGAGAILPGISGGVLAVIFGIYRPFMELLTHPLQGIAKYSNWFLPLAVGWCIGFLGFAKGIAAALDVSGTATTWLFIGLIVGTLPQLMQEAGKNGRSAASGVSFLACALVAFGVLFYVSRIVHVSVTPNFWWYTFCGALWGISAVIPGLASSSVLMGLGLYQPMLEGVAQLQLSVLSAALPGMLLTIVLLARGVNRLFQRHYAVAFHGVLGFVLASTLTIIPVYYQSGREIALSVLCCAGGFALAFALARLETRIQPL